ncbi:hypothetical protein AWZ03_014184, partial [Drosophila navojoa]
MRGRHLRRRFSLQPSFMKDDSAEDKPKRDKTIEEMHQGNFSIAGVSLTLDILDTAGSYE